MKTSARTSQRTTRGEWSFDGFTRLELAAVLATVTLLAAVAWPVLAHTKPRAQRVTCVNNLAWIGRAAHRWAGENGDRLPVRVPYFEGGAYQHPLNGQIWFHLVLMSNELATPKVLACPSDPTARPARNFLDDPWGGFMNVNYRNNAVSYMLGLDSFAEYPTSLIAGDRSFKFTYTTSTCQTGVRSSAAVDAHNLDPQAGWTMSIHPGTGNLLLMDGRVEETSTARLRRVLAAPFDDNGSLHFLMPRYP